uniref:Uncharacterized protein n=1 Tax=Anguilla anguilla TaxID=7936 RepID=A0A0E9Q7X5_ANGAN
MDSAWSNRYDRGHRVKSPMSYFCCAQSQQLLRKSELTL